MKTPKMKFVPAHNSNTLKQNIQNPKAAAHECCLALLPLTKWEGWLSVPLIATLYRLSASSSFSVPNEILPAHTETQTSRSAIEVFAYDDNEVKCCKHLMYAAVGGRHVGGVVGPDAIGVVGASLANEMFQVLQGVLKNSPNEDLDFDGLTHGLHQVMNLNLQYAHNYFCFTQMHYLATNEVQNSPPRRYMRRGVAPRKWERGSAVQLQFWFFRPIRRCKQSYL